MTIDSQLIAEVQRLASDASVHRVRTMLACYIGYASMLKDHPELRARAKAMEHALRDFCVTGVLAPPSAAR